MNRNTVEKNWMEDKSDLKARLGSMTDDRLEVVAGKRNQLEGKIQNAYCNYRNETD